MKKILIIIGFLLTQFSNAQVEGKWKKISAIIEYDGKKIDMHKALLASRPCAKDVFYEINSDKTFRLNASQSTCDEKYKKIQEKLYSEQVWTIKGNKITIGHKKAPAVGQTYTFIIKGNIMTWTGTEGQGIETYQRIK